MDCEKEKKSENKQIKPRTSENSKKNHKTPQIMKKHCIYKTRIYCLKTERALENYKTESQNSNKELKR